MRYRSGLLLFVFSMGVVGCTRISAQLVEKPRVDQQITGNQGVLVGKAEPVPPRKETRQILEINIELPTMAELNPWREPATKASADISSAQGVATVVQAPVVVISRPHPTVLPISPALESVKGAVPQPKPAAMPVPAASTYTVQAGDTLDKIAASFYGDSKQWQRIFEANREMLQSPNRIYKGQSLVIPPPKPSERMETAEETQFK